MISTWLPFQKRRRRRRAKAELDDDDDKPTKGMVLFTVALDSWLDVCNGDPAGESLEHYCTSYSCCSGYDVKITIKKAMLACINCFFGALPQVPNWGKWTQTGECLDKIAPMFWFSRMLPNLMEIAFSRLSITLDATLEGAAMNFMFEETNWHEVGGKRLKKGMAFASDPSRAIDLTVWAIVLEPIRKLHFFAMGCKAAQAKDIALCHLLSSRGSIVVQVLQYLSDLLAGRGRRLQLLWRVVARCSSYQEWLASCPADAANCAGVCSAHCRGPIGGTTCT